MSLLIYGGLSKFMAYICHTILPMIKYTGKINSVNKFWKKKNVESLMSIHGLLNLLNKF